MKDRASHPVPCTNLRQYMSHTSDTSTDLVITITTTVTSHAAMYGGRIYTGVRTPDACEPPGGFRCEDPPEFLALYGWWDAVPHWERDICAVGPDVCECGSPWSLDHDCYWMRGEAHTARMLG